MKKKINFILKLLIIIIIIIIFNFDINFKLEVLKYFLITLYLYILIDSIKKYNIFHPYTLLLITFGVFLLSRIFLNIFGLFDLSKLNFFIKINISDKENIEVFKMLIVALLAFDFSARNQKRNHNFIIKQDLQLFKLGKIVFFSFYILALIKPLIILNFVKTYGYLALRNPIFNTLRYPLYTKGAQLLTRVGYYTLIASGLSKKKFIKYTFLFLPLVIPNLLMGYRGEFITLILALLSLYFMQYKTKIKVSLVMLSGFSIVMLSQVIKLMRNNRDVEFSIIKQFQIFFSEQGVSVGILNFMVKYKEVLINTSHPYILSPMFLTFQNFGSQTYERVLKFNRLSDKLAFFLDQSLYLKGLGTGSTFIAELYEFGMTGIFIGCFIVIKILFIFYKKAHSNRTILYLFIFFMSPLFFLPRSSLIFISIEILIKILIFYGLINFLKKIIERSVQK